MRAAAEDLRITIHAHEEMVVEAIEYSELLEAIDSAHMLEAYPDHRRGPCCLLNGRTKRGRSLHIVCTMGDPALIIITIYVPESPKWVTPTQRS